MASGNYLKVKLKGNASTPSAFGSRLKLFADSLFINHEIDGGNTFHLSNEVMGIVKDALWIDLNFDGLEDLILVGEWMPITVFLNQKGKLKKQSNYFSTKNLNRIQNEYINKKFSVRIS